MLDNELKTFNGDPNCFLRFDDIYSLSLNSDYFAQFGKQLTKAQQKANKSQRQLEELFVRNFKDLLNRLIGDARVAACDVFINVSASDKLNASDCRRFVVGLMLGEKWAEPLTRGPQANKPDGRQFREDFGDLSEIRKFADNALCETVEWVKLDRSGFPAASECFWKPMPQRWLEFIVYTKLSCPPKSLRRLVTHPQFWVSLLPRSQLPPSFLPLALAKLTKTFREVKDLSLQIVGVNCVSTHYRDTEPIRLIKAANMLREFNKKPFRKLKLDEYIPPLQPTVEVHITLERNGKWGKNPVQIAAYKTQYYAELGTALSKQSRLTAVPQKDRLLVLLDSVVFAVRLIHDDELEKQAEAAADFEPGLAKHSYTLPAHTAVLAQQLQAVAQRFTAFAEAAQLAKRWLSACKLSGHLDDLAVEMMVALGFLNPGGRAVESLIPMTPLAGFLQFLRLLREHDFVSTPLFFDPNEALGPDALEQIRADFLKHRPVLPCICISTPEDRAGVRFTARRPEPLVMCRLLELARKTFADLTDRLAHCKPVDLEILFDSPADVYDLVITLHPQKRTHFFSRAAKEKQEQQKKPAPRPPNMQPILPVLDFSPTDRLAEELRKRLDKWALFFHDRLLPNELYVLLRPRFRKRLEQSTEQKEGQARPWTVQTLIEQIKETGEGMISDVVDLTDPDKEQKPPVDQPQKRKHPEALQKKEVGSGNSGKRRKLKSEG